MTEKDNNNGGLSDNDFVRTMKDKQINTMEDQIAVTVKDDPPPTQPSHVPRWMMGLFVLVVLLCILGLYAHARLWSLEIELSLEISWDSQNQANPN